MKQQWTAPAEPQSVSSLRAAVAQFAADAGLDPDIVAAVKLAVSEALTNSIVHGYRDGRSGQLMVVAERQAAHVSIVVSDEGVGMRPRPDSPGMGVGLPLIATLADKQRSPQALMAAPSCR